MGDPTFSVSVPSEQLPLGTEHVTETGVDAPGSEQQAEAIRAKRAAIHDHYRQTVAAAAADEAADSDAEPIEDVESVVVRLPNGREVEYGPRANVAHRIRVAQIVGAQPNVLLSMAVQTLLNVRKIDGQIVRSIGNLVDAQAVLNQIGDDGLDLLDQVHMKCWKPIDQKALPILKKNLRQP